MNDAAPRITHDDVADLFLFRDLSPGAVDLLLPSLREVRLEPGEILFTPGEYNDTLYLVLEGRLQVQLESPDSVPITVLERGEGVGELSVIDRLETSAYVTAQGPCRLASLDQMSLWTGINEHDGFARNLLYLISRRIRSDNERTIATRRRQRQWEHYATVDALTGLQNRRWLDESFGRQLERSRRAGEPLSLLMFDVDNFKRYNDNEGHVAGDYALMGVARVLREQLRPSDRAIRYGGEEFCVLLPRTERLAAVLVAERLRNAIAAAAIRTDEGEPLPGVTASFGVTELQPEDTMLAVIKRADAALYRAKQAGRNRVAT